ncbi:MAG: hypothetical protein Q9217_006538 [Psora testacea]
MILRGQTYSHGDIIRYCANAPEDEILGGSDHGNRVVRFNNDYAIKWGVGVYELEYYNQIEAFRLLDPDIVRVPKPHDFFTDDSGRGYLVMDAMPGVNKKIIEGEADVEALTRVLDHFAIFKSSNPGPLALRGPSYALLFGESDHPTLNTTSELQEWFNHRLLHSDRQLDFSRFDMVLCHMDFFPRNILWEANQPPCLLDWLTAGYWPRIFERCSHLIVEGYESNCVIINTSVTGPELAQIDLILKAWRNIQWYSL